MALDYSDWRQFRTAQKSVTLPAGTVAHTALTIRYLDEGEGSRGSLLLLHGIPTWGFLFHAAVPALIEAGYRVVVPDFQGFGWSDQRDCFDRSFQDQAKMVLALMHHLELLYAHVVGHDTGGAVALILAIEHPATVQRMVLCNCVCYDRFDDDMLDFGHPMRWLPRPVSDLVAALDESLVAGLSHAGQLTPAFRNGIVAPWNSEQGKRSLSRNASALNANQTMALVDRHGSVSAPTLVLWGMDDPWQKAEDGQQLAAEIPTARFHAVDGASHWLPQDDPAAFYGALRVFLG